MNIDLKEIIKLKNKGRKVMSYLLKLDKERYATTVYRLISMIDYLLKEKNDI